MPNCRICSADESSQSIRSPHVFGGKEEHNFWQCEKCNAIYLYPILSQEEEKYFYLKEFEGFMSTRVGDQRDWSNADRHKSTNQDQVLRRMPFLEDYLKPKIDLLEIGCSSGFMLDAFREKNINCYGVEPSGEFNEYLNKQGYEVFSDLSEIENKKFDVITHFFVFEHIADPYTFLKANMDLLNEDGVIIAEIPCANDPLTSKYNIEAFEKFYWSIAHHYYYTPESLTYILEQLDFQFKIVPEQRYDLSNHMSWMMNGRPGGQNKYDDFLGVELVEMYKNRMIETWQCDTMFLYVWK